MIPVEHKQVAKLDPFEAGLVLGILIGEGHFGGDGRQPQVTLRLNVRHEPLFRWLQQRFPTAKLYGPYQHSGRRYFQMMWRGPQLLYWLMPLLESTPWRDIDAHSFERYASMKERYGLADVPAYARDLSYGVVAGDVERPADGAGTPPPSNVTARGR